MNDNTARIVIIGGGIAGITCIESLFQGFDSHIETLWLVTLISEQRLVKRIGNLELRGRDLHRFDVIECDIEHIFEADTIPNGIKFKWVLGRAKSVSISEKTVIVSCLEGEKIIHYDKLCICTGSTPKSMETIFSKHKEDIDSRTVVIRDTSTVKDFQQKLANCERIAIVGNGGISLELVDRISNCQKTWIIRDDSVGLTFFDSGAAKFLLDSISDISRQEGTIQSPPIASKPSDVKKFYGPALGPEWHQNLNLSGISQDGNLDIIYKDEVEFVDFVAGKKWPLVLTTKNGRRVECDLLVMTIGVTPNNISILGGALELDSDDGGICIDEQMRTGVPDVYAAGDVVSVKKWSPNELWHHKRLWTQARKMGFYAGKCIHYHLIGEDPTLFFNFDCFTHCTSFFGYKLVLLGQYNGQMLSLDDMSKCAIVARVIRGKDYVKLLLKDGKIIGAVLVGDSGLDETIENLIHDRIDVSEYKDQLLDNTIDIEDYFD